MSEKRIKVVIDTQLFLRAAINRQSLPAKLIIERRDSYILAASAEISAEVNDVLNRPELRAKFKTLTDHAVEEVIIRLSSAELVNLGEVEAISRDSKDDIFLACAKVSGSQYLVSEDKDLLVLNPYEGIQIINALEFWHVLNKQAADEQADKIDTETDSE